MNNKNLILKGKLLTLGSSEFIKRNFGVGYHLSISPLDLSATNLQGFHQEKQVLMECVSNCVPSAKLNPQTTQDVLSFILPFKDQENFTDLFQKLERIAEHQPIHVN